METILLQLLAQQETRAKTLELSAKGKKRPKDSPKKITFDDIANTIRKQFPDTTIGLTGEAVRSKKRNMDLEEQKQKQKQTTQHTTNSGGSSSNDAGQTSNPGDSFDPFSHLKCTCLEIRIISSFGSKFKQRIENEHSVVTFSTLRKTIEIDKVGNNLGGLYDTDDTDDMHIKGIRIKRGGAGEFVTLVNYVDELKREETRVAKKTWITKNVNVVFSFVASKTCGDKVTLGKSSKKGEKIVTDYHERDVLRTEYLMVDSVRESFDGGNEIKEYMLAPWKSFDTISVQKYQIPAFEHVPIFNVKTYEVKLPDGWKGKLDDYLERKIIELRTKGESKTFFVSEFTSKTKPRSQQYTLNKYFISQLKSDYKFSNHITENQYEEINKHFSIESIDGKKGIDVVLNSSSSDKQFTYTDCNRETQRKWLGEQYTSTFKFKCDRLNTKKDSNGDDKKVDVNPEKQKKENECTVGLGYYWHASTAVALSYYFLAHDEEKVDQKLAMEFMHPEKSYFKERDPTYAVKNVFAERLLRDIFHVPNGIKDGTAVSEDIRSKIHNFFLLPEYYKYVKMNTGGVDKNVFDTLWFNDFVSPIQMGSSLPLEGGLGSPLISPISDNNGHWMTQSALEELVADDIEDMIDPNHLASVTLPDDFWPGVEP
tara:strand:+ start:5960 stop:7915 length:1956 start_codon:yes stop_codon:yes gene_type:complete